MDKVLVFDLHGTLSESRMPLSDKMASLLGNLLDRNIVPIVSGSTLKQFEKELVSRLNGHDYHNLWLYPSEGTELYQWMDGWGKTYGIELSPPDIDRIRVALNSVIKSVGIIPMRSHGENFLVRGGQVTYSVLGFGCPLDIKKRWDGDLSKRKVMRNKLLTIIPEYDVTIGGYTSLNINHKGMGKPYCIKDVCERLGCTMDDIIYVANEFYDGGDDVPVREMGVMCVEVTCPSDTERFIEDYLG